MSLTEAAASGDRLRALEELRDVLARSIEACESGRDLAALSRQMQQVLSEIAEVSARGHVGKGTTLDELVRRRAARSPGAAPVGEAGSG